MSDSNFIKTFLLGVVCFVVGILLISQNIIIKTTTYAWTIGGTRLSNGVIFVPFFISLVAMFISKHKYITGLLMFCSILFIVVSVILGTSVTLVRMSMLTYVLIFGSFFIGIACIAKCFFNAKKNTDKDDKKANK